MEHGPDKDGSKVDEILFACLDRPEPAWEQAVEASCREHPDLAAEILARFKTLRCFGMTETEPPALTRIGEYELLHPIGGGTMGTVFLARHADVEHPVAVKILRSGLHLSVAARHRFAREREIAAKLHHPGICAVTDAGEVDGVPFLAMEFVDGGSLTDYIARHAAHGPSLDVAAIHETLKIIEGVARALDAAHGAGLIHRDIKPGNIVIRGNGQPVLLDFGLARDLQDEGLKLTVSGTILGSPAYLAPEVISGGATADARSDIYSLGVTLYEALTLQLPYIAPTREALFHRVLNDPFPDPRKRHPGINRQLVAVLRAVLDRSPNRRYSTARALADDLVRVREGRRVSVRYPGTVSRCIAWAKRKPLAAAFVGVILLALLTTALLLREVQGGLNRLRALGLASMASSVDPELSVLLARRAVELLEDPATVSQLHAAVARYHHPQVYPKGDDEIVACEFRPGDAGVLCVSAKSQLMIFGPDRELVGQIEGVRQAIAGPASDQVLIRRQDGAFLWQAAAAELQRIGADEALAIQVTTTAVLVVSRDTSGALWLESSAVPLESPRPVATVARVSLGRGEDCGGVIISPDGRTVFVLAGRKLQCFDRSGRVLATAAAETLFAVSHDGRSAVVELDGQLLWLRLCGAGQQNETQRLEVVVTLPFHSVRCAFSPDDRRLAVLEQRRTLRVYGVEGELLFTVPPHGNLVHDVVFSPDGRFIATGDGGAVARIVHASDGTETAVLRGHDGHVRSVAFSPDGQHIATGSYDHKLRVFGVRPGVDHRFAVDDHRVVQVDAAVDRILAVGGAGDVWSWPGGARLASGADCACFVAGGDIVVGGRDGRCRLLDPAGVEIQILDASPVEDALAGVSPDTQRTRFVGFTRRGWIRVWERDASRWRRATGFATELRPGIWSADVSGRGAVACAVADGRVFVLGPDGSETTSFQAHSDVIWSVRYSPADDAILTASRDNTARLWSPRGVLLAEFLDHAHTVHGGVFSPDGLTIATVSTDETVRLWNRSGQCQAVLSGHVGQVLGAAFTADGEQVVSGAFDGCLRVWPVRTERLLQLSRRLVDRPFTGAELERCREYLDAETAIAK